MRGVVAGEEYVEEGFEDCAVKEPETAVAVGYRLRKGKYFELFVGGNSGSVGLGNLGYRRVRLEGYVCLV